jgi:pimeloyl-ACP methyl ester carboxylesterase
LERASTDGAELEYEVSGRGEPVVFVHGAFIADTFRPLLAQPRLAGQYRLILYHRRGYAGSSRASGPTSVEQQAADCRALLAHLAVERAHVVGHSFGGDIALQLALDTPAVVHSLVLIEPGLMIGASGGPYREALARGGQRYREADAAVVVDEFLQARSPGYRDRLDHLVSGAFAQAVADAGTWFETELPAQLAWHFATAEARLITQPVLSVLGGESTRLWDRFGETHRWLLASLPHAEGFVLPGATHLPQIERPRGLAEGLATFFARHPAPS